MLTLETKAPRVAFGRLPVESDAQIAARARISPADVQDAKRWVKSLTKSILAVDVVGSGPRTRWILASVYQQLWEARGL